MKHQHVRRQLASIVFSVLAISSIGKADEQYFSCSGGKDDNYIHVLGAIEKTTNTIRIGASTSQSTTTGYYKSVLVTGKAEVDQNTIKFNGSGGGNYASGHIVLDGTHLVSKFYSDEFESILLTCSSTLKPDQHRVCRGRWFACSNLLNEHSCCYEPPH